MDIDLTLTHLIVARAILIWLPALITIVIVLHRRLLGLRLRIVGIVAIIGLALDIAYHLLAFILSNPGQGAEGS